VILERGGAVDKKRIGLPDTDHFINGAAVFLCSLYCQTTCLPSAKYPANHWFSNSYLYSYYQLLGAKRKLTQARFVQFLVGKTLV